MHLPSSAAIACEPVDPVKLKLVCPRTLPGLPTIRNLTRAEALIDPTKAGVAEQAAVVALRELGFVTYPMSDDVADQARD